MNTRTTSIRLKNDLVDEIDSKCERLGCCRNDYIKDAIEMKLNGHKNNSIEDEIQNCTDCDELVHECLRTITDNVHGSDYTLTTSEKTGKPIEAELRWYENDDEGYFEKEWQKRKNQG